MEERGRKVRTAGMWNAYRRSTFTGFEFEKQRKKFNSVELYFGVSSR